MGDHSNGPRPYPATYRVNPSVPATPLIPKSLVMVGKPGVKMALPM